MARGPSAAGKTRLSEDLSPDRLAALRTALLADTLCVAAQVGRVDVFVFFTPADARAELAALAAHRFEYVPQSDGDLGERMRSALDHVLRACGYDAAILIGTDIPLLTPAHVADAREVLETHGGVVIGPADDGGYYLIGMTQVQQHLFERIEWGIASVLTDTLRAAEQSGVDARLIRSAYDIDTMADLRRLERDLASTAPDIAPGVRRWLHEGRESG
jgi:rSAM/selenodomain-associated transferase 1